MTNLSEVLHFQKPIIALDQARRTHCEVWTRVMGYHRPVTSFNTGKQGEFNERLFFNETQPG